jgi:hypothetical protein
MSRFAKALAPAAGTVLAVAVQWGVTGSFDRAELVTALTGLSAAAITFWIPNAPPPAE